MTKILVFVPTNGRNEVVRLCYDNLGSLITQGKDYDLEFIPFIVWSQEEDKILLDNYGWHNIQAPNQPLGRKKNLGLAHALETIEFDYLMQMDSDAITSDNFCDVYAPYFKANNPFFGSNHIYFMDWSTEPKRICYTMNPGPWGAGRCIRRDILEKVSICYHIQHSTSGAGPKGIRKAGEQTYWPVRKYNPNSMGLLDTVKHVKHWDDKINSGLDTNSENKVWRFLNIRPDSVQSEQPVIMDIKTDGNIHGFNEVLNYVGSKAIVEDEKIKKMFSVLSIDDDKKTKQGRGNRTKGRGGINP